MAKTEKQDPTEEGQVDALDRLDGMVRQVSSALHSLREENGYLKEMLERRGEHPEVAADWMEERAEVRRRVQRLTELLDGLLGGE